jgi:two-component system response regulator FlrC
VIRPEHIQFELANDGADLRGSELPGAAAEAAGTDAADAAAASSLATSLGHAERDLILDALRTGQGSRREAAVRLGISARTLRYKLARLREAGIDVPAA